MVPFVPCLTHTHSSTNNFVYGTRTFCLLAIATGYFTILHHMFDYTSYRGRERGREARAVGCPWGVPSGAVKPTCAAGVETNTGSARFGEIGLEGSINLFPVEGMRFGTSFERFDVLPCVTWDIWTIWRSGIIVAKKVVSVEDIGQTSRRKKWIEFKL